MDESEDSNEEVSDSPEDTQEKKAIKKENKSEEEETRSGQPIEEPELPEKTISIPEPEPSPEPTSEPIPEPTVESIPESKPGTSPEPTLERGSESSPEPTPEPTLEPGLEPSLNEQIETSTKASLGELDTKIENEISPSISENEESEKKDTFLELDDTTRTKMIAMEEEEARAEEEARLAAEEEEMQEKGIFAIKTSIGHEKMVANWLAIRARKRKLDVFAILSPPKLRGYLLMEGIKNKEALQDLIKGVQHARSVVDGSSSIEEIEHFLTPKPLVSGIEEGDVVEIIAGPFKGEKAKVTQIDESKEEITVELFEAMVSIPVTIRGDHVRILEKETK